MSQQVVSLAQALADTVRHEMGADEFDRISGADADTIVKALAMLAALVVKDDVVAADSFVGAFREVVAHPAARGGDVN